MVEIISWGKETDPKALRLDTRKGRHIENEVYKQDSPEIMRARIEAVRNAYPEVRLLSASSVYNCYGLVFASRRTRILDANAVMRVLEDDDYYPLPWDPAAWQIGDVVLYRKKDDPTREIRHVAIIAEKRPQLESGEFDVWVVSAWRDHGEYYHRIRDVQPILGQPSQVVSQRVMFP